MSVKFTDNSAQVTAQMEKNIGKALEMIGLKFVEISTKEANKQIYETSESPNYVRTSNYKKGMTYQVKKAKKWF